MKLPQELEKIKNEKSEKYIRSECGDCEYCDHNQASFDNGFNQGALEVKAMADEKLVEAIKEAREAPNYVLAIVIMDKALANWEAGWKE